MRCLLDKIKQFYQERVLGESIWEKKFVREIVNVVFRTLTFATAVQENR